MEAPLRAKSAIYDCLVYKFSTRIICGPGNGFPISTNVVVVVVVVGVVM